MSDKICKIDDCGRAHIARGYCTRHYQKWRAHGDPLGGADRYATAEEAFAARTERRGECLIWTGCIDEKGYGHLSVGGKVVGAHRYAWEREHGPINPGLDVDHAIHCDHACVETAHLRTATRSENTMNRSGAAAHNKLGHRNVSAWGSKYVVRVRHEGRLYGGVHADLADAIQEAEELRQRFFGAFAGRG